jgi:hypothetical protein
MPSITLTTIGDLINQGMSASLVVQSMPETRRD